MEDQYYLEQKLLEERKATATGAARAEALEMEKVREQLMSEMGSEPWSMVEDVFLNQAKDLATGRGGGGHNHHGGEQEKC